jgi:hypothetical protein
MRKLSLIINVQKKNKKLWIYVDFHKLNVTTNNYTSFIVHRWNIEYCCWEWDILIFIQCFTTSLNFHSTKKLVWNCFFYQLGSLRMDSYAFWCKTIHQLINELSSKHFIYMKIHSWSLINWLFTHHKCWIMLSITIQHYKESCPFQTMCLRLVSKSTIYVIINVIVFHSTMVKTNCNCTFDYKVI